jgi:KUP system potassium uptake protein
VQLRFGFTEEPNVERYLEDMARHQEIDLPAHPRQWVVHVSHENLLGARDMGVLRRLRFRLFLLLRLISRPTYYGYHLGGEVHCLQRYCRSGCIKLPTHKPVAQRTQHAAISAP